jgi:glutaredoxin
VAPGDRAVFLDAPRRLRARRSARRRGDGHARVVPVARVTLYHAAACHLCERAQAQLAVLRDELGFQLEEIDITGDPKLEAAYREWLPVVEVDGARAFVYYLDEAAFRRKLSQT